MQIDENKRPRSALKTYFAKNAIPTEGQFAQLIDSLINQRDDGMVKNAGDPLSIEATGDDVGQKRAMNFYRSFADADPAWTISLKPRSKPADPGTGRAGWSVGDAAGNSNLCIDAANGNVGIGTISPAEKLEVSGRMRAGAVTIGPWPPNTAYSFFGSSALDQADQRNYAVLQKNDANGATCVNSPTKVHLRIGNGDRLTIDKDNVTVMGSLSIAGSDLYFTETDHQHTGIGNKIGYAAIENAANYGALMILGRSMPERGGYNRVVKLWDVLEINGTLSINGDTSIRGKHAFRGNDTWLRLNQDGAFTSGTHTPGLFAPMSLNVGGHRGWEANPGNGSVFVAGDLLVKGRIGAMDYGPGPRTSGWGGGLRTWDLEVEATAWSRNGWQTGARDLAETYYSDDALEIGDVVGLTDQGDGIAATSQSCDPRVIGIVSAKPGLLLGSLHEPDEEEAADTRVAHPIALLGCTPCKVTDEGGPIRRGDLLTPAPTPGHAMRAAGDQVPGTIIGKALESHDEGVGAIEVFVMLR